MTDFQQALGRFLIFTAGIAAAIRMNSEYNDFAERNPKVPFDVMWLSDALHSLDELGRAVQDGYPTRVVTACDRQISIWEGYKVPVKEAARLKSSPHETFERWAHLAQLDEGIEILKLLRAQAQEAIDSLEMTRS